MDNKKKLEALKKLSKFNTEDPYIKELKKKKKNRADNIKEEIKSGKYLDDMPEKESIDYASMDKDERDRTIDNKDRKKRREFYEKYRSPASEKISKEEEDKKYFDKLKEKRKKRYEAMKDK